MLHVMVMMLRLTVLSLLLLVLLKHNVERTQLLLILVTAWIVQLRTV